MGLFIAPCLFIAPMFIYCSNYRHLRDQRSTNLYLIKRWGKMVIDDQQQAEGVQLASHN